MISRLTARLQHLPPTRFTNSVATTHARLASCWLGCAFTGRESNPRDRLERFQVTSVLLSRPLPDASRMHRELRERIPQIAKYAFCADSIVQLGAGFLSGTDRSHSPMHRANRHTGEPL